MDSSSNCKPHDDLLKSKEPADHPRRARNRRTAFSVKEVREEAAKLQVSEQDRIRRPDLIGSTRQCVGSGSGDKLTGRMKKKLDGSVMLPEKYKMLSKFFDSLDSSIRLLRLKGSMCTFTNISPKVECLTDRRFSYAHLAQLKFILPEVIEMKKVLVHDERNSCMKPDLHISLNFDAIKNERELKSTSDNSHMRKVFHSRLLGFFKDHPEEEVPEETLPEPFNRLNLHTNTSNASSSSLIALTEALPELQPAAATHVSHTFRKRFSKQILRYATAITNQQKDTVCLQPSVLPVSELHVDQSSNEGRISEFTAPSSTKFSLKPPMDENFSSREASEASVSPSHPHMYPLKQRDCLENEASSSVGTPTIQGTPAKLVSTPVKLMSTTPAPHPPKRCCMSPDDSSTSSGSKLTRRPLRNRSLQFDSPVKNIVLEREVNDIGGVAVDNDIFDILPGNLLQSIREKEWKSLEEKDPAISQAKRRQKMIASLPKLFDMVRFLFQSINRSVVTKEEFMRQLVANHLDIVDRGEVEDQVKLLQELVPEWISEKLASSGVRLICINKMSSLDSMRARIVDPK